MTLHRDKAIEHDGTAQLCNLDTTKSKESPQEILHCEHGHVNGNIESVIQIYKICIRWCVRGYCHRPQQYTVYSKTKADCWVGNKEKYNLVYPKLKMDSRLWFKITKSHFNYAYFLSILSFIYPHKFTMSDVYASPHKCLFGNKHHDM